MSEQVPERTEPRRGGGNVLSQKLGALPVWVWMVIGLAAAMGYYLYKKNSSSATASTSTEAPGTTQPADQVPPYIIQNYSTDVNAQTVGATTQSVGPVTTTIPPTTPPPATPPPKTPPPKKPPPKTTPPPKTSQEFTTVTVVPWKASDTPWNSTLWGIATHYNVSGGYETLAKLNNISNPNLIYPGQKIKVPITSTPAKKA